MTRTYDAIVVGARCAGSPTAMLLARRGHHVLLVDRDTFPSDTMSTHLVHPGGVAALGRWGVLPRVAGSGCPPVTRYSFDFGPVTISGTPRAVDGVSVAYGPRRYVLDTLLVAAAAEAGVEVREGFTVDELITEDGTVTGVRGRSRSGAAVTERARVVVGADGRHSRVARAVRPTQYSEAPTRSAVYYAYWSGLPVDGFETYVRAEHGRGWAALPTNDALTCVVQGWPRWQAEANRRDLEATYLRSFELVPQFADRVHAATRETRLVGTLDLGGYLRVPHGPGWVLVGDAGYHKHPITAFGITDAFRDAEAVAAALDDVLCGRRAFDEALGGYHSARDEHVTALYDLTNDFSTLEPPPAELQALLAAIQGDQEAMDDFVSVLADTLPPAVFFDPANVARLTARPAAVPAQLS